MARLLRLGSTGTDVLDVQAALNRRGSSSLPPLAEDGVFGPKTQARVQEFQGANALVADGVVGPITLDKLSAGGTVAPSGAASRITQILRQPLPSHQSFQGAAFAPASFAPASLGPGLRRVQAPCPGSSDNRVVIEEGSGIAPVGISKLKNLGTCPLGVGGYDANGRFLGAIILEPGQVIEEFVPAITSVTLAITCDSSCSGTAILEYQRPLVA